MSFLQQSRQPAADSRTRQPSRGATQTRQGPSPVQVFAQLMGDLVRLIPWGKLALGGTVALLAGLTPWVLSTGVTSMDRQFNQVTIQGELNRLDPAHLEASLEPWMGRSYFATDLNGIKEWVERQPWVQSAAISRQWPGTLTVEVIEQHPVAYWNEQSLLNREGQVFAPMDTTPAGPIPALSGPQAKAGEVLQRARQFADKLAPHDLRLAGMALESRGAWTLQLDNGITLALGRDRVEERFDRFLSVYSSHLGAVAAAVKGVDARYDNGVSVQWRETETVASRGDQTW
ncbi:MAG: FtsQ-type POTRA domain-containing protein [Halomonadaceae bacterium]|nr:MAG: FtsQ-type POTRA domain-containing protein [Halomonadaceae bacterium]